MSISLKEWSANPIIQTLVRLTEIENEMIVLEEAQKVLWDNLKKEDRLTYYDFKQIPLAERQSLILLNKSVAEQIKERDYLCDFKLDERMATLHDRLQKYYDDTPDSVSNQAAMTLWADFRQWCLRRGFTQEEINQAKRGKFN